MEEKGEESGRDREGENEQTENIETRYETYLNGKRRNIKRTEHNLRRNGRSNKAGQRIV